MKTRFSTVDIRAVLAELNARYRTTGDQAHAGGAGDRGRGPTISNKTSPLFPGTLTCAVLLWTWLGLGGRARAFFPWPAGHPLLLRGCESRQVCGPLVAGFSLCRPESPGLAADD